jgi:hypothetical protein
MKFYNILIINILLTINCKNRWLKLSYHFGYVMLKGLIFIIEKMSYNTHHFEYDL